MKLASAVVVLTLLVTIGASFHALAQSEEGQVFQLIRGIDTKVINLYVLTEQFHFGTATIKLTLDGSGNVAGLPQVEEDAARRGKEAFAEALVNIMSSWKFTPGASGPMYVTVAVPSEGEAETEGKIASISVDLKSLALAEGLTIGLEKPQVLGLVAQEGFYDNVYLAGAPPKVIEAYEKKGYVFLGGVWGKLGPFFQVVFTILFLGLVGTLVWSWKKVFRPWEPTIKGQSGGLLFWSRKKAKRNGFESEPAKQIEELWIKAIHNSQNGDDWDNGGKPHIIGALEICKQQKENYPLFEIFESGLQNHLVNGNKWWTSQEVDRAVDRTAAIRVEERRGPLDWLWAIGSLSPLFGLFGTVWGISQAFGKIKGVTDTRLLMQKLAGDINIALSTTIVGLLLAVPAFIFYYYFKYRVDNDATRIERYFGEITNRA